MSPSFIQMVKVALVAELEQLGVAVRELVQPLSEAALWQQPVQPGNSIGHLILHLCGNLHHFVGAHLGKTGYQRDREREFTETQHPAKEELLRRLDEAVATFGKVVRQLDETQLTAPHPEARLGTVLQALLHLVAHFALHRGQMSYISRLVAIDSANSPQ